MGNYGKNMKRKGNCQIDLEGELSNIDIIERPIDPSVQKEYHDLSDTIDLDNVNYEEVLTEADKLFVRDVPIEEKKRTLILLAHLKTMESVKILERYLKVSEAGLKDWAVLALKECRMLVEGVFLDEEEGFISTGLGGKGNKMRYYFIVSTKEGRPLTVAERENLERGFRRRSDEYGAEIEGITIGNNYAMVGILVPMEVAVGEVIEEGIRRCNKTGQVLLKDYYVTNVKKPSEVEISEYLGQIRRNR